MLILLSTTVVCATGFSYVQSNVAQGTSSDVLQSLGSVVDQIYGSYKSCLGLTINIAGGKRLNSPNVSQSLMNEAYNNSSKKIVTVTGTCSEVAVLMLVKSYGFASTYTNEAAFIEIMNIAIDNNYWKNGTAVSNIDNLATKSFTHFLSKKRGNNDILNMYNTIKSEVDEGKTSVFSCSNHSMLAVGYISFEVSYYTLFLNIKNWKIWHSATFDYIIVNDGWSTATTDIDSLQYSYYPASLINVYSRLTKVTGYDS